MKKIFIPVLSIILVISLVGCGQTAENTNDESKVNESSSAGTFEVEQNLFDVKVTLASTLVKDKTEDEIRKEAKEKGFSKCEINEDGSVTYTMSKSKHAEILKELKDNLISVVNSLTESDDKAESFISIDYTEDFSRFDIYVDSSKYSAWDSLYALTLYISGAYYQTFSGIASDKIDVTVNFIDNETKEVLNSASYKDYEKNSNQISEESNSAGETTKPQTVSAKELKLKEKINVPDDCEFYIDYTKITEDVIPPSPSSWYSHYEADKGKTYVDICVAYKNLSTRDIEADEVLSGTLIYGEKYEYSGFSIIEEENRGDFTYSNITDISPLSSEYVHYLFEVPEEVKEGAGSVKAILNIADEKYSITVKEATEGELVELSEKAIPKTSGHVNKKEEIVIMNNCEFYVDFSDITTDVKPPKQNDWYSHYEADKGKTYVDFCIAYKNWKYKSVEADEVVSAKLKYADKYEYTGFSIIEEENRGDFTYSNITNISPLATEYIHYLFEVPEEVENSTEPIEISFSIGGNMYTYKVR